jgi:predicted nucleotidyltransferase
MTIQALKTKILPILKRQGVTKAGVSGSFVGSETKKDSDIDILVEFNKKEKIGLFEFVGLKLKREKKLGGGNR